MNVQDLKYLTTLQEYELLDTLPNLLERRGYTNMLITDSYVYAQGNIPVLLVAHVDTFFNKYVPDSKIFYNPKNSTLWSPLGIGGDDRCGVYAILDIVQSLNCHVLFTTGEEIGGIGSYQFCNDFRGQLDVKFMLEFDRAGENDAVFYDCGNKEFQKFILQYGFKLEYGTFTDIAILGPDFDIASVNLSIGYYKQHSKNETIRFNEVQATIAKAKNIIKNSISCKYFDHQEISYSVNTGVSGKKSNYYLGMGKNEFYFVGDEIYSVENDLYAEYDLNRLDDLYAKEDIYSPYDYMGERFISRKHRK